ncbi:uncharacterized protein GLRG_11998 [Colletotrichum graminicola M1.001]|uniref:Uncharacterized protein n=1 Tax=Colletotrichum graminicola (strain M1.001 / M2 / FGSC 10212) TaxID=645133 RepID=E3R164_COLGM|nr:uncharacterized protein GLRG_11998 [Colletotrichum graminicola M1.001]EFQ36852.1 hypothetical protein GLRG_11998 [Colletotrichum graminicola M1.001]
MGTGTEAGPLDLGHFIPNLRRLGFPTNRLPSRLSRRTCRPLNKAASWAEDPLCSPPQEYLSPQEPTIS